MTMYREYEISCELFGNKFSASGEKYGVDAAFDKWLKKLDEHIEREKAKKLGVVLAHPAAKTSDSVADLSAVVSTDAGLDVEF